MQGNPDNRLLFLIFFNFFIIIIGQRLEIFLWYKGSAGISEQRGNSEHLLIC